MLVTIRKGLENKKPKKMYHNALCNLKCRKGLDTMYISTASFCKTELGKEGTTSSKDSCREGYCSLQDNYFKKDNGKQCFSLGGGRKYTEGEYSEVFKNQK